MLYIILSRYILSNTFDIEWIWVKAHSTDELNNEVDLLARSSANN